MLIDTGASRTCISLEAAQKLQLRPIDRLKTYGAGGLHELDVYQARLTIVITGKDGDQTTMEATRRVTGIPQLQSSLAPLGIKGGDRSEGPLIGLIGRDFLRHATFIYSGSKGLIEVRMDHKSLLGQ